MSPTTRDKIVSDLRKEEKRVATAAQEARETVKALEAELKGLRSALAALTGEAKRTPKKNPNQDASVAAVNDEAKPSPKRKKKPAQEKSKASKPTPDDTA